MFTGFKRSADDLAPDVKGIRDRLLRLLKEQLQQWEGGEAGNLRGLRLYLFPEAAQEPVYRSAVYADEPGRFKENELQRIADDYGIALPADWYFELLFEAPPEAAVRAGEVAAALVVDSGKRKAPEQPARPAKVRVLQGEAEQAEYRLEPDGGRYNIGRDRTVQAADGFHRVNQIAFLVESQQEPNKFVSRQHAHIEWDAEGGAFLLFADEGGIPPRNKVKVRPQGGEPVKLQSTHIGYTLRPGDQIILGDSALLQFDEA